MGGSSKLHVGYICVLLSVQIVERFRLSSKHSSHMEGLCLLVK